MRPPLAGGFRHYFAIARTAIGHGFYGLVLLNLVSAVVESVGILLFIPFLSQLGGAESAAPDRMTRLLQRFFADWHMALTVGYTLSLLVAVFVLKGSILFYLDSVRQRLVNRTEHQLRQRLIALYAHVDYPYALAKSKGFFGNLIVTEVPRARVALGGFCRALSALITTGILFAAVLVLHGSLSLAVIVAGGFSALLIRRLGSATRRYSERVATSNARLHEFLDQALIAFKYLKATQRFGALQSHLKVASGDIKGSYDRLAILSALQGALQEPVLVILIASIFYYAVVVADAQVASVLVSVLFFYRCMIEMGHFQNHWQFFTAHAGSLDVVWNTIGDLQRHLESGGGASFEFRESIELRDVTFTYQDQPVLRAIRMHIPKNASIALVGTSGAGKTTLIDLIAGLLPPTRGSLRIDGKDLGELDLSQYRRLLGYVGQDTVLFDDTIANNIRMQWGSAIDGDEWKRIRWAARASHCEEFIRRFPQGYDTLVGERGVTLSGGQRQRLAIARELFKEPAILILDEATSSLDSQSEGYIQRGIEGLKGTLTLIIVSHRLSTVRHVDTIYVLDRGRIVEQGGFDVLSQRPGTRFRRMCELQRIGIAPMDAKSS